MIIKRKILAIFRGIVSNKVSAKEFLKEIEIRFAKSNNAETSTLLANLILLKYKAEENIRD